MDIANNLESVRKRISAACDRSGRDPSEITLVAVSKTKPVSDILAARDAGQSDFGENYLQDAEPKIEEIKKQGTILNWHFIGHLQTNKAGMVVSLFSMIHSVDSVRLAAEISKRAVGLGRKMPILVEVNIAGEDSKSGVSPEGLSALLDEISLLPGVEVQGLMAMAPHVEPERTRPYFKKMRELRDSLLPRFPSLKHLSMGMTSDFEVAIEEGATIVRIGTAIFGERNKK